MKKNIEIERFQAEVSDSEQREYFEMFLGGAAQNRRLLVMAGLIPAIHVFPA
jgi:hypothetical protein